MSEGFAFPYGMCPYCGGKLTALERPGVSEDAGIHAIRLAFEIELGGLDFYSQASRQSTDPALKELFAKLAGMEREHMETLSRRYHLTPPERSGDFRADLAAIRVGVDGNGTPPRCLRQPLRSRSAPSTSSKSSRSPRQKAPSSKSFTGSSQRKRSSMSPFWKLSSSGGNTANMECSDTQGTEAAVSTAA